MVWIANKTGKKFPKSQSVANGTSIKTIYISVICVLFLCTRVEHTIFSLALVFNSSKILVYASIFLLLFITVSDITNTNLEKYMIPVGS